MQPTIFERAFAIPMLTWPPTPVTLTSRPMEPTPMSDPIDNPPSDSEPSADALAETSDLPSAPAFVQPIVALPNRGFFIKRMIIAAVVIGFAGFFLYDGFVRYPDHNAQVHSTAAAIADAESKHQIDLADKLNRDLKELGVVHQDRDIFLQKVIGFLLIPLGLYLFAKFLREGRGELKLADDTIHVPGHPPVPIAAITGLHNARWDKKGVALFDYKLADGTTGQFKLDDFVFNRPPTDAIHDELIEKMPKA